MRKVSVAMSVYNGEEYLRAAIDSILTQTFDDFEFIIVDDGSTDRSAEIVRTYTDGRIVLLQQSNQGVAPALNHALQFARENMSHGRMLMISRCPSGSPGRSNFSTRTQSWSSVGLSNSTTVSPGTLHTYDITANFPTG